MTQKDLDFIKDAFSQIIDDIGGNPDWYEAARAVASDLGTLERELKEKVIELPPNLDEAANEKVDELIADMKINGDMIYLPTARVLMIALARFGAEWMAGQGVSMLGKVGIYGVDVESITKELREAGFNLGEEIILQIRKKQ